MVSWCSWLSRQSNTLKVSGSSPGEIIFFLFHYTFIHLETRARHNFYATLVSSFSSTLDLRVLATETLSMRLTSHQFAVSQGGML
jgi:hypothetical protein